MPHPDSTGDVGLGDSPTLRASGDSRAWPLPACPGPRRARRWALRACAGCQREPDGRGPVMHGWGSGRAGTSMAVARHAHRRVVGRSGGAQWAYVRSIRCHPAPAGPGALVPRRHLACDRVARSELECGPDRRAWAVLERVPHGGGGATAPARELRAGTARRAGCRPRTARRFVSPAAWDAQGFRMRVWSGRVGVSAGWG